MPRDSSSSETGSEAVDMETGSLSSRTTQQSTIQAPQHTATTGTVLSAPSTEDSEEVNNVPVSPSDHRVMQQWERHEANLRTYAHTSYNWDSNQLYDGRHTMHDGEEGYENEWGYEREGKTSNIADKKICGVKLLPLLLGSVVVLCGVVACNKMKADAKAREDAPLMGTAVYKDQFGRVYHEREEMGADRYAGLRDAAGARVDVSNLSDLNLLNGEPVNPLTHPCLWLSQQYGGSTTQWVMRISCGCCAAACCCGLLCKSLGTMMMDGCARDTAYYYGIDELGLGRGGSNGWFAFAKSQEQIQKEDQLIRDSKARIEQAKREGITDRGDVNNAYQNWKQRVNEERPWMNDCCWHPCCCLYEVLSCWNYYFCAVDKYMTGMGMLNVVVCCPCGWSDPKEKCCQPMVCCFPCTNYIFCCCR